MKRNTALAGAQLLVPVLLRLLAELERGDPARWKPTMEHFFLQGSYQYGRRAVLVALAVGLVRYARHRAHAEECGRIQRLLREVENAGA